MKSSGSKMICRLRASLALKGTIHTLDKIRSRPTSSITEADLRKVLRGAVRAVRALNTGSTLVFKDPDGTEREVVIPKLELGRVR